jgi:hypothetical protein
MSDASLIIAPCQFEEKNVLMFSREPFADQNPFTPICVMSLPVVLRLISCQSLPAGRSTTRLRRLKRPQRQHKYELFQRCGSYHIAALFRPTVPRSFPGRGSLSSGMAARNSDN